MLCELYQFITAASSVITPGSTSTTIYRYTNGPIPLSIHEDLTSDPVIYAPQPITRSDIAYTSSGVADADIDIPYDIEPFYAMRLANIQTPTWLRIWEYDGTTRTLIFFGRISTKNFSGSKITKVKAVSIDKLLDRRFPVNTFSTMCRHGFGPNTQCGLTGLSDTVTATAGMHSGYLFSITVAGNFVSITDIATLAGGSVVINDNPPLLIVSASEALGVAAIRTLQPPKNPVADGDFLYFTQGCDLRLATCAAYGNLVNNGSFPYLPEAPI